MLGRRFLLLVAVLMGLTALAASVAPREPPVRDRRAATPSPSATPTAEAAVGPSDIRSVDKTISASEGPARITVRQGDLVHLTVESAELDTVSLMDEFKPVEAQSPAEFDLLADKPGSYAIELLNAKRRIGTLVVRGVD
jgi:hypothetical protein